MRRLWSGIIGAVFGGIWEVGTYSLWTDGHPGAAVVFALGSLAAAAAYAVWSCSWGHLAAVAARRHRRELRVLEEIRAAGRDASESIERARR